MISLAVEERSAPPLGEPLVSNEELARRLGVSIDTLAEERAQDRLDGYRFHGEWRYSRQQIDAYLEALRAGKVSVCNQLQQSVTLEKRR
jgi:hypothetical protein